MKLFFVCLGVFCFVFAGASKVSYASPPPNAYVLQYDGDSIQLKDPPNLIDLGMSPQGRALQWSMKVENNSDQVLLISNVRGSCGFQVLSWPRDPVLPGNSGTIQMRYDASRKGSFSRNLTISANTYNSVTIIPVRGEVYSE